VEAIELLNMSSSATESEHYPVNPTPIPWMYCDFFWSRNGLSQRDNRNELGSESTVSLILAASAA